MTNTSPNARTLLDKIWDAHCVQAESVEAPGVMYVDLHLIHEVTSPQAFTELRQRGLQVRCPERVLATLDHSTPTQKPDATGQHTYITTQAAEQVHTFTWLEQRTSWHRACDWP